MNRHAMRKTKLFPLALFATLALAACGSGKAPLDQAPLAGAQIGGDFALQDKTGKTVRWSDFKGKWRIVYFGYTFCPDACPLDVGIAMKGFAQFSGAQPQLAADVQPIFISVDPTRDTPARVGEFAAAFSPRLLGLTGSPTEIARTAKAFAVFFGRGQDLPGGAYIVDHSRAVYLFDRAGQPIAMLPVDKGAQDGPAAVAAELEKWVR
jgi:protein SCO1/2